MFGRFRSSGLYYTGSKTITGHIRTYRAESFQCIVLAGLTAAKSTFSALSRHCRVRQASLSSVSMNTGRSMNIKTVFHINIGGTRSILPLASLRPRPHRGATTTRRAQLSDHHLYSELSPTTAESYLLNMMNEDGTAALFSRRRASGVTGWLERHPSTAGRRHLPSRMAAQRSPQGQVGWAKLDPFNTGLDVSVWVIIKSSDPRTLNWTTQSRIASIPMVISNSIPIEIPFDQTNGIVCGVADVNLFPTPAYLSVDVLDVNGLVIDSFSGYLLPFSHYQRLLADISAKTIEIAGTFGASILRIPGDALTMAMMGIKATNYTVGWTTTSLAYLRRPCRILNINALGRAEIAVFAEHSRAALTRATLVLRIHFKYFQRDGITTYTSTDRVRTWPPAL